MSVQLIIDYFPKLTELQTQQFTHLEALYSEWNQQINVISRKDFEHFYERHVLHALAIAKFITFKEGSSIIDLGTGGGFPGIPLAILFPTTQFTLIDGIGKKIKVVEEVVSALALQNVIPIKGRAEELKEKFDFVVSRAVAPMQELSNWSQKLIKKEDQHAVPNGIIALKGGDLKEELKPFKKNKIVVDIHTYFPLPYFETKKLVHVF